MRFSTTLLMIGMLVISSMTITFNQADAAEEKRKLLLIYTTNDIHRDENIHMLDATFSAFSTSQTVVVADDFTPTLLIDTDTVVFIGDAKMELPPLLIKALDSFNGDIIAFGNNVEQLKVFSDWDVQGEVVLRALDGMSLAMPISVQHVKPPKDAEVLAMGESLNDQVPFISKRGRLAYIASSSFDRQEKYLISKNIYSLLDIEPPEVHPAYIRLEDISPVSDHKLVKKTGDYLADQGIPFYLAIIPVYVNNETGEQIKMSSNKQLVEVLLHLQKRGGIVISHGYTHSYRYEETGEGFEFWDDQLNQKITTERTNKLPSPIPAREAFTSNERYTAFMNEIDSIEERYTRRKLRKSIEELADIGLYALAFEAPHYTMSSTGYKIAADYFTSIFGQVQLSDSDWEVMDAPLFISKPEILSGMTLYPETIGYANPELADPLEEVRKSVERIREVPGAIVGAFYHPYLGMDYLEEMIQLIYSVGTIEWLDLRKTEQTIKTDNVTIVQQADGVLKVDTARTQWDRVRERLEEHPMEGVLWGMTIIVVLFLIAFSIHIANLRIGLRKRLFREREFFG